MTSHRYLRFVVGAAGFVAGAVPLLMAINSPGGAHRAVIAAIGPVIGWAFIGAGLYAWARRPANRFGPLMITVGFSFCVASLSVAREPWLHTIGLLFLPLPYLDPHPARLPDWRTDEPLGASDRWAELFKRDGRALVRSVVPKHAPPGHAAQSSPVCRRRSRCRDVVSAAIHGGRPASCRTSSHLGPPLARSVGLPTASPRPGIHQRGSGHGVDGRLVPGEPRQTA